MSETDPKRPPDEPLAPGGTAEAPEAPSMEQLQAQLRAAEDRALRAHAELENFRRRTRREAEDQIKYANLPLFQDLLPVLDNIQRTIDAAAKTSDAEALLTGVKMVAKQLDDVFAKRHCKRIEAVNQPFDPNVHSAVMQQPSTAVAQGVVLQELQSGYQLFDRVVRPTQVIVSAGRPET